MRGILGAVIVSLGFVLGGCSVGEGEGGRGSCVLSLREAIRSNTCFSSAKRGGGGRGGEQKRVYAGSGRFSFAKRVCGKQT